MKKMQAFIGCFFIAIAAFLYAVKHITAAIISAFMNRPDVNYYEGAYDLVGTGLTFWIFASLLVGIVLMIVSLTNGLKLPVRKKQEQQELEQK